MAEYTIKSTGRGKVHLVRLSITLGFHPGKKPQAIVP